MSSLKKTCARRPLYFSTTYGGTQHFYVHKKDKLWALRSPVPQEWYELAGAGYPRAVVDTEIKAGRWIKEDGPPEGAPPCP